MPPGNASAAPGSDPAMRGDPPRPNLAWLQPSAPRDPGGTTTMIGEDVMVPSSEADQLRQQLLEGQRLSSMGALASSVAHEFNNILTTIINYAKMGLHAPGDDKTCTEALEKILKGGQRAATIVNSMLGFARNNSTQRQMTDLSKLIE